MSAYLKTPKRQEKCRNSASNPYWWSVKNQKRILLEACDSNCNRNL